MMDEARPTGATTRHGMNNMGAKERRAFVCRFGIDGMNNMGAKERRAFVCRFGNDICAGHAIFVVSG
jgi:hypothetical protein